MVKRIKKWWKKWFLPSRPSYGELYPTISFEMSRATQLDWKWVFRGGGCE